MAYSYPRKSKYRFRVGRSSAGLGLFARERIRRDDFVIEYFGPYISDDEADRKGGRYLFQIKKDCVIDGSSRENIARYMNHSCKPNCEAEIDGRRVFLYALRDIEPGEELTYDYGKEYVEDYIKPFGCRCVHCRTKRGGAAVAA